MKSNEILYKILDLQIMFVFRRSSSAGITFSNDNNLIKQRSCVPFRWGIYSTVSHSPYLSHGVAPS